MPMRLKSDLYPAEQGQVRRKILDILALDRENSITLYELDNDVEKQKNIMSLLPEIVNWFAVRSSLAAQNPEKAHRPWMCLVRFVLKPKYKIIREDYRLKIDNNIIRTQKYVRLNQTN
jgi:hypothetical protein